MQERSTEVLIVGGGLGGIAGALAALRLGKRVILTEETDWLGGQLTSQAVPPDEHDWIENIGCTASYRSLRDRIRNYYRRNYPLLPEAREEKYLNPGMGTVSPICHEPRVGAAAVEEMLAPYRAARKLEVLTQHRPVSVDSKDDSVRAVTLVDKKTGDQVVISAPYTLDATELSDLLPLAGVEHVMGSESRGDTGELHAIEGESQPLDQQAITWVFAIDHLPGEDHTIAKPKQYDFWRQYQADFWPGPQLGWVDCDPVTLKARTRTLFGGQTDRERSGDFWHYRRILYRKHYPNGLYTSDIVSVNWPQIDYWLGPLVGVSEKKKQENLYEAKQLSLSMLYWMQTEAPRLDSSQGYPGLRLRGDIMDTIDGLAKDIYVRESRRIKAEFTVLEDHVGVEARGNLKGAEMFHDSVGVGSYRIDLHPSTAPRNYVDMPSWPFQIPLGALLPVRVRNLLPACKNIGTTHITNGCYRLHPVEWNIGEAAGALAAYCLEKHLTPHEVRNTAAHLHDFQRVLMQTLGFELEWPEPIRLTEARIQ